MPIICKTRKGIFMLVVWSCAIMLTGIPASAGAPDGPAQLCKQGETVLFGFQMEKSSKFVAFCTNKKEDYMVYRFGTAAKVELEYPQNRKDTWSKFSQIHFGEECDRKGKGSYLAFTIGDVGYTVRERCFFNDESIADKNAADEAYQVDIEVKNAKTGKTTVLMGREGTRSGSLELVDTRIPSREL